MCACICVCFVLVCVCLRECVCARVCVCVWRQPVLLFCQTNCISLYIDDVGVQKVWYGKRLYKNDTFGHCHLPYFFFLSVMARLCTNSASEAKNTAQDWMNGSCSVHRCTLTFWKVVLSSGKRVIMLTLPRNIQLIILRLQHANERFKGVSRRFTIQFCHQSFSLWTFRKVPRSKLFVKISMAVCHRKAWLMFSGSVISMLFLKLKGRV